MQSVAMQTRRNAADLDEFTRAFEGRLMALNRAHQLLTREIGNGVLLEDLCRLALEPFDQGSKVRMHGPPVRLFSEVSVSMAMALHELATNATKYGALSAEQGHIAVDWTIETTNNEQQQIVFEWSEHGGPQVSPPQRRGFGSELVERGLARQLGGKATLSFEKPGFRCRIEAPLRRTEQASS